MSRMELGDRLKTIAFTAVLTSVGWIAFGGGVIREVGDLFVLLETAGTSSSSVSVTASPPPVMIAPREKASPRVVAVGDYVIPVAGVRPGQLTDTFTAARAGGTRVHDAIDILAPRGTPVVAAVGGTVEKLFSSKAGGLTIYVRSPDKRTITYYAHLDTYAPGLSEGQTVGQGQQLGTVGFTGNADPSAPHLHFAIMETTPDSDWWEPSLAINPYPVLTGRAR